MATKRWPYYAAAGGAGFLLLRPLFMPSQIVAIAKSQVGSGYQSKYGGATNWCAVFAGWAVETAAQSLGFRAPSWRYENGKPVAGAKRLVVRAAEAGQWIAKDGVLLATPRPGDLVSFDRGEEGSWQGHVGIITNYQGGILTDISGNYGGKVSVVTKKLADRRLEAIARPDFSNPFVVNLALTAGLSYGAYRYLLR